MSSAEEAVAYAKKLHELVQWIGICDGNMQEGNFRCDVNVSVKKKGEKKLGTRREIKNLNSFKFIKQAVDYEVNWQKERLEKEGKIKRLLINISKPTNQEEKPYAAFCFKKKNINHSLIHYYDYHVYTL